MENGAKEAAIRRYFDAWLTQSIALLDGLFDDAVVYTESWGPEYTGYDQLLHWFGNGTTAPRWLNGTLPSLFIRG